MHHHHQVWKIGSLLIQLNYLRYTVFLYLDNRNYSEASEDHIAHHARSPTDSLLLSYFVENWVTDNKQFFLGLKRFLAETNEPLYRDFVTHPT